MTLKNLIDDNFHNVKFYDVICNKCDFVNGKDTKDSFKKSSCLEKIFLCKELTFKEYILMLKQWLTKRINQE